MTVVAAAATVVADAAGATNLSTPPFVGGRREIVVVCPGCEFRSTVPPAAIGRNAYFCSRCGKALDLQAQLRQQVPTGEGGALAPRRDKGTSKYKSARKGRR